MVPRAEASLPKTGTKPTPFVGVRGQALALRYPGVPPQVLRRRGGAEAHLLPKDYSSCVKRVLGFWSQDFGLAVPCVSASVRCCAFCRSPRCRRWEMRPRLHREHANRQLFFRRRRRRAARTAGDAVTTRQARECAAPSKSAPTTRSQQDKNSSAAIHTAAA